MDSVNVILGQATHLQDSAFRDHYRQLVKNILESKTLDYQDLIDVLTLNPSQHNERNGFAEACHVLKIAEQSSPIHRQGPRHSALVTIWRRAFLADDWPTIRTTSGLTTAEVEQRLRGTTLYDLLRHLRGKRELWLQPTDALSVPTPSQTAARFTQLSADTLEAFAMEYGREQQHLVHYLDSVGLTELFEQITKLVDDDARREAQEFQAPEL